MLLAQVTLEYGWKKKLEALNLLDYNLLRSRTGPRLPALQSELKGMDEYQFHYTGVMMDHEEIASWSEAGVKTTLENVKGVHSGTKDIQNTIYQISVADIGLMAIKRVEVLTDYETYQLQGELDRGWRLLAVMPPMNGEHPSYVVGHVKQDADR